MELFKDANYDFLGKKWPAIILSLVVITAGVVSMALKGGIKYGIDFTGGALMYVKFSEPPPVAQIRAVLEKKIPGSVDVQMLTDGNNEVIISTELKDQSTEVKDERALEQARQTMVETLNSTFGQPQSGKIDFNNASQETLSGKLRDPLQRGGVQLSEPQLTQLVRDILAYRNSPPRSGLIRSFDELSTVPGVNATIISTLKQEAYLAPFAVRQVEVVGPKVANDLRRQGVTATLLALAGMLVYIGFRFEWIYGFAAVLAVFHDTIVTVGFFSLFNKEIDLTIIAALLTLVGYSMNDTIVIFDRVRENLKLLRREPLESLMNKSVNQTLGRSVLTSGLTFLTVLALFLFGGPKLNGFSFALVVGIIAGSYSTIFIASPIVLFWNSFVEGRKRGSGGRPAEIPAVDRKTTFPGTAKAPTGKRESKPLAKKAK